VYDGSNLNLNEEQIVNEDELVGKKQKSFRARIKSLTEKSTLTIEFSDIMLDQNSGVNMTLINDSLLNLTINPCQATLNRL